MSTAKHTAEPKKLNGTAIKDFVCKGCDGAVKTGERIWMYRERALSMREACYAGTMYPMRLRCATCAGHVAGGVTSTPKGNK